MQTTPADMNSVVDAVLSLREAERCSPASPRYDMALAEVRRQLHLAGCDDGDVSLALAQCVYSRPLALVKYLVGIGVPGELGIEKLQALVSDHSRWS